MRHAIALALVFGCAGPYEAADSGADTGPPPVYPLPTCSSGEPARPICPSGYVAVCGHGWARYACITSCIIIAPPAECRFAGSEPECAESVPVCWPAPPDCCF